MAADERKDNARETHPETKHDEEMKDLAARKLEEEKEKNVKGGIGYRPSIADEA